MVFKKTLNNFLKNLEALDLFLEAQSDLINHNEKTSFRLEKKENTLEALTSIKQVLELASNENKQDEISSKVNIKEQLLELGVEITEEDGRTTIGFKDREFAENFQRVLNIGDLTQRQIEMVYRNSLTSLMIYFENLVSNIIKQRLQLFPNSFNPNEKSIKYGDLIQFENLSDALDHLIDNEVIGIMYGGFKSWVTYLNKAGVKTKKVDILLEEINEAYNRRNLFVHNDGVINNVYLNKVNSKFTKGLSKGAPIHITEMYLKGAIEAVKKYGVLLLLESWNSFGGENESEERKQYVEEIAYEALKKGQWEFAKHLYEFIFDDTEQFGTKTTCQINIWLCEKMVGKYDDIKDDIISCDVSGLKTQYKLCLLALLEENDTFFKLLEKEPDSLNKRELAEWPILASIRKDKRTEDFLAINS
ncbi:hypothetical protein ACIGC1_10435 [Peribacillus butanolivorans]|uniref:hypothetical protein n=1 Tax=Peribacillus butanolivorans TaxID=421767 RepID=UPI0037C5872E